jgi:hypothetical protein
LPQPWREEAAPPLVATGPEEDAAEAPTADGPPGAVPDAGIADEPAAVVEVPVLAEAPGEGPRPAMVAEVGGRADADVSPPPPASSSAPEGQSPAEGVPPLAVPETAIPLASSVADDLWDWSSPPSAEASPVPRGRVLALVAAGAAALGASARSPEGSRAATFESPGRSRLRVVPRRRGKGREPGQADDAPPTSIEAEDRPGIDIGPGVARSPEDSAAAGGIGTARSVSDGSTEPRATDGADAWIGAGGAASADPALPRVRAYEAAALRQLMDVLRWIDDPAVDMAVDMAMVPTREDRAAALAELEAARADGTMTGAQVVSRRARLAAVGEAGPRLRSLAELRDAGYLTDDDLRRKRAAITGELARLLGEPG